MVNLISDMIEVVMITFIAYIPHTEDKQHNKYNDDTEINC